MLFTEEEIKERWREYVSELYDDPTRPEAVEIDIEGDGGMQITKDEVKKVIKKMKTGKAPGVDALTTLPFFGIRQYAPLALIACSI